MLIVDDSVEIRRILVDALKDLCTPVVAHSGARALEIAAREDPPDLILLDILMPEMDGYQVCRTLKAQDRTRDIPLLFVTSLDEVEDEAKGLELGAVDYITKPISPSIVRARVKNYLELNLRRDMLEELCSIDGLTCIPNRRCFDEALEQEWRRSIRARRPISIIMLDLDYFKEYNDGYGHVAGDECLKLVAQTLHSSMRRGGDVAARYGGEEFVALLPETDLDGAVAVATTLKSELEALDITHVYSEVADRVTVSLGVATMVPGPDTLPETLIQSADRALYEAKENGRNQVRTAPQ